MLPGAHQQVLSNLDSHFEEFLEDSEESEVFTVADRAHSEREVGACKQYYEELLRSAERGRAKLYLFIFFLFSYCGRGRETHASLSLLTAKLIPFGITWSDGF